VRSVHLVNGMRPPGPSETNGVPAGATAEAVWVASARHANSSAHMGLARRFSIV
jgi:hypothetical protein